MQYEQLPDGRMIALPKPSIDTGMGLERIGAVLQGKHDNFDTDVLRALIEASAQLTGTDPDGARKVHHRVIADHVRACAFLIADGVLPANEGRGYVLRRIMRRAMRHAHLLGVDQPLLHRLVPTLVRTMGGHYTELARAQALIIETLRLEESRFRETLARGLRLLEAEVAKLPEGAPLPGSVAFKLYDTYGFPLDLTQDALRELNRTVDVAGFEAAMAEQRTRARAAWAGSGESAQAPIWFTIADEHGPTEFLGYETETAEAVVLALVRDGRKIDSLSAGERGHLVVNQTPFYAEAGGQVGDTGFVRWEGGQAQVTDTRKQAGVFIHDILVREGRLEPGQPVKLEVDHARRSAIRANHSATHLLHEALRERLGEHVAQKGSLNAPDRLRFDFSHAAALSADDLSAVEAEVNAYIRQDSPVETRIMTPDEARALGALALFGEKYGDEVRVVSMGVKPGSGRGPDGNAYSVELCGGTHVARTGEIGVCVILGDSAISAGVRRIEALTGQAALAYLRAQEARLEAAAEAMKCAPAEVPERVRALVEERRALQAELARLKRELALKGAGTRFSPRTIAGIAFVGEVLSGVEGRDLPPLVDQIKADLGSGVVVLIADAGGGKPAVAVGVTADLTGRLSAVDLARRAVAELGGKGGGGRPDLAQGGGGDIAHAEGALKAVEEMIMKVPA